MFDDVPKVDTRMSNLPSRLSDWVIRRTFSIVDSLSLIEGEIGNEIKRWKIVNQSFVFTLCQSRSIWCHQLSFRWKTFVLRWRPTDSHWSTAASGPTKAGPARTAAPLGASSSDPARRCRRSSDGLSSMTSALSRLLWRFSLRHRDELSNYRFLMCSAVCIERKMESSLKMLLEFWFYFLLSRCTKTEHKLRWEMRNFQFSLQSGWKRW